MKLDSGELEPEYTQVVENNRAKAISCSSRYPVKISACSVSSAAKNLHFFQKIAFFT
jgi:hypothetical protein